MCARACMHIYTKQIYKDQTHAESEAVEVAAVRTHAYAEYTDIR